MSAKRAPQLPPCEETAPITDNWCYSQVNIAKCRYTWIINNFTFCRTEVGKVLRSSPFGPEANSALTWSLMLHPNGDGEDSAGYLSVYLRLLSGNKSEVQAKYTCSIIDSKKEKCHTHEGKRSRMIQRTNYGWKKFIELDVLCDKDSGLLPDDVLTICCEITAFGNIVNVSGLRTKVPECRLLDNLGEALNNGKFADVTLIVRMRSDGDGSAESRASGQSEEEKGGSAENTENTENIEKSPQPIETPEVEAGKRELRAHKVILAACSPVFAAMFDHDMIEQQRNRVDITDVSDEILREMLNFMYTGKAENLEKMAYELLVAADKYAMETLKVICEDTLCASIAIDNVADYLVLADLHNANSLKAQAIEFVNIHTTEVMATDGFKEMVKSHPHLIAEALHVSATRKKLRVSSVF